MVAPKQGFSALSTSQSAAPVVSVGTVKFGNDLPISIIAGPCQLESRQHALEVASALKEIAARLKIGLVYKTSFDKANRTSASAARGLGLAQSLPIFTEIRSTLGLPVLTDVHTVEEIAAVSSVTPSPVAPWSLTSIAFAGSAVARRTAVEEGVVGTAPATTAQSARSHITTPSR